MAEGGQSVKSVLLDRIGRPPHVNHGESDGERIARHRHLLVAALHRILHRLPASGVYWRILPVTR